MNELAQLKLQNEILKKQVEVTTQKNIGYAAEVAALKQKLQLAEITLSKLQNPFGNVAAEMKVEASLEGDINERDLS